jgi:hypothetical protein
VDVCTKQDTLEDSACLICSDNAKIKGQLTKELILTFLNPSETDSENLSFLVVNHTLNIIISPNEFSCGLSGNEHLQKTSSSQLPSTLLVAFCQSLPVQPVACCQAEYEEQRLKIQMKKMYFLPSQP